LHVAGCLSQSSMRWIERALLDAQHVARNLLDALGYGPAMPGFERQCLQDEQV
jgi:hypothetical protein